MALGEIRVERENTKQSPELGEIRVERVNTKQSPELGEIGVERVKHETESGIRRNRG